MPAVHLAAQLTVPFEGLRNALSSDPVALAGSPDRAYLLSSKVAGVVVEKPITITIGEYLESEDGRVFAIPVRLAAADHRRWFPSLDAEFEFTQTATGAVEVALEGHYRPPAGLLGALANRAGLRRLATESLHGYFEAVVDRLRRVGRGQEALKGVPYS